MQKVALSKELGATTYPGRGIVIGRSKDGKKAVTAYFIMGRSANSRNRVFVEDGEGIRTQAFDPSKLEDPSLIIYAPVRVLGNKTIVTNGDQTDTIYELMDKQQTFEQALRTREFEPDAPNYTPRISGIMHIDKGEFNYAMSILKSNNGNPVHPQNSPNLPFLFFSGCPHTGQFFISILRPVVPSSSFASFSKTCWFMRQSFNARCAPAVEIP